MLQSNIIALTDKPEVKCPKKTYARLAEEARITCTVKMNPEASQSSWSWVDAGGNETILNIGEEQNGFSAEQSQKVGSSVHTQRIIPCSVIDYAKNFTV